LQLERIERVNLKSRRDLVGCIQDEGENKASIFLYNPGDSDSVAGSEELSIANSMFTRTYKIDDLPSISSHKGVIMQLNNPTYKWRQFPILNGPANLESGIELLGWNVADETKISMLMRNNSENPINTAAGQWLYIDPSEDMLACMMSSALRDCLIYSFLVMSPETFKSQDNKLLGILKAEPIRARVCYRNGDGQDYREPDENGCP
jgi:hypothetical protein